MKNMLKGVGIGIASAENTLNLLYNESEPDVKSYFGNTNSEEFKERMEKLEELARKEIGKEVKFQCVPMKQNEHQSLDQIDMTKVKYVKIEDA